MSHSCWNSLRPHRGLLSEEVTMGFSHYIKNTGVCLVNMTQRESVMCVNSLEMSLMLPAAENALHKQAFLCSKGFFCFVFVGLAAIVS